MAGREYTVSVIITCKFPFHSYFPKIMVLRPPIMVFRSVSISIEKKTSRNLFHFFSTMLKPRYMRSAKDEKTIATPDIMPAPASSEVPVIAKATPANPPRITERIYAIFFLFISYLRTSDMKYTFKGAASMVGSAISRLYSMFITRGSFIFRPSLYTRRASAWRQDQGLLKWE